MTLMIVVIASVMMMTATDEGMHIDTLATGQFLAQTHALLGVTLEGNWAGTSELLENAVRELEACRVALGSGGLRCRGSCCCWCSRSGFRFLCLFGGSDLGNALVRNIVGSLLLPFGVGEFVANVISDAALDQVALKVDLNKTLNYLNCFPVTSV